MCFLQHYEKKLETAEPKDFVFHVCFNIFLCPAHHEKKIKKTIFSLKQNKTSGRAAISTGTVLLKTRRNIVHATT